jgi:hypothetical protein
MNRVIAAAMLLLVSAAAMVVAGECDCVCPGCGQDCCPIKVCRLVSEKKKVPKVTYSTECEDFCVQGHSQKTGCRYECRDGCDVECLPDRLKLRKVWNWSPCCGEVKSRVKLVKKTTEVEEVVHKCVVVTICPHCQASCDAVTAPAP